jgi:hypothetical protein
MRARRVIIIVVIVTVGLLVAAAFLQLAYTGPGVRGNLIMLEVAKARWLHDHKGGVEWVTKNDLRTYLTNGMPRSVRGEIYIVNKVGEPVYAYDPKTERLVSLDSKGLDVVKDYLEQAK